MSTESNNSSNGHLPLALIAVTIAILLAGQIGATRQGASFMRFQSENLEKQIAQMQALDKQAAEAIKQRDAVVKQANEIQNQLQSLLNELLDLAEKDKDKDAAAIIEKWKVQRNQPPTAPAAAAPAAGAPAAGAPAAPAPAAK